MHPKFYRQLPAWLCLGTGLSDRPRGARLRRRIFGRGAGQTLEDRTLLSSSGIESVWFQSAMASPDTRLAGRSAPETAIENQQSPATSSWIVQLAPEAVAGLSHVSQASALLQGMPANFEVVRGLGRIGQVQVRTWNGNSADIADWFRSNGSVVSAVSDSLIQLSAIPNDPSYRSQLNLENFGQNFGIAGVDIDAEAAWEKTTGSPTTIVAVIDTGIDYTHPDLAANIWTNPGEIAGDLIDNDGNGFVDDVHGWDFTNNDAQPLDDHGHGTQVAGIIGAVGDNGLGIAGINWHVSLMAVKAFNSAGQSLESNLVAAVNYVTMMRERGTNVRVTNNSYGDNNFDQAMYDAIKASSDQGILFFAGAGNSAANIDVNRFYPAGYNLDNIISVAATDRTDSLAFFSSYGTIGVDLAAPGTDILTTALNSGYMGATGTSMATPHVAGVAALALSLFPDATYQQVRTAILNSVTPLPSLAGLVATGGRLNANNTLNSLLQQMTATPAGYLAAATPYEAIDLAAGAPGVVTVLTGVDDAAAAINLGSSTFTFYGKQYTGAAALFASSNGLVTLGSGNSASSNTNLTTSPAQAAIAPLWDNLLTDAGSHVLARLQDTTGDGVPDRLIIEWSGVRSSPGSSPGTFQVILQLNTGTADGNIVFNYVDLDFGNAAVNNGAAATVGVKAAGTQGPDRLLVALNNGVHPLIGSGRAIRLDRVRPQGAINVIPNPNPAVIPFADVVFSEPIDPSSFDFRDIRLTLNGGPNLISSAVTVSQLTSTIFRINGLNSLTAANGSYLLTVNLAGIFDVSGHIGYGTATATYPTPNIRMVSATADGATTVTLTYQIDNAPAVPFDLGVYRSDDSVFGGDTLLGTLSLTAAADLTVGVHTRTWTIGSAAGSLPLPGAGSPLVNSDYSLLFVADPADALVEVESGGPSADNVVLFSGVYHAPLGPVMVQGTGQNDSILANGPLSVSLNGVSYTYSSGDVSGLSVRASGGNDVVDAAVFTQALTAYGGAGSDTLIGSAAADLLNGGGGDDGLTGNAGNDTLVGGDGNDVYWFNCNVAQGSDALTETATGGSDTLEFSNTTSRTVTLNLAVATVQVVNTQLSLTLGSATTFENVVGGGLSDVLTGNTLANSIGGGAGNDTITGGAGDDTLSGGIGDDVYVFNMGSGLGSDSLIEVPGGGADLLDFSSSTTRSVVIDLSKATPQTVSTNLTLTLCAGTVFENVTGSSLNDLLSGNSQANVLRGGAGNDTLTGADGDDTLVGGAGNDSYLFKADLSLGNDSLDESGGGTDILDFSGTTSQSVQVNLGLAAVQVVNSNLTLTLGSASTLERVVGGSLADVLTGNSLANSLTGGGGNDTLTGGAGNDSLVGGAGNDVYVFAADSVLGSDTITEVANGGADTLDFSSTATQSVAVNLGLATAQVVNQFLTLTLGSGSTFENVLGGALNDTLTGNALANELTGGGGNDTLTGGNGADTLAAGSGDDTYLFSANAALGSDTVIEAVDGGTDLLDFSATTTKAVTVDLSKTTLQSVSSNLKLTLSSGSVFENVIGGSMNDQLTGNSLGNSLSGGAGNDSISGADGNDILSGGAGNDSLTGGNGDDMFLFNSNQALGSDTVVETAAGGIDTLDFSATTALAINANLSLTASQIINSNLTLTLGGGNFVENAVGGAQNDLLAGNALANRLSGGAGNDTLNGGAGDDVFAFAADSNLGSDTILETTGGGADTLDFSQTTFQGVTADLSVATPQVVNTFLSLTLPAGEVVENAVGGAGDDAFTGNSAANLFAGGAGRDALLGGAAGDTFLGGAGDDLLTITGTDYALIDGESGGDTLRVDGAGLTLDLTTQVGTRVTHLELIDLRGTGSNYLLITEQAVAASNSSHTLTVLRDNDTINPGLGWTLTGFQQFGSGSYSVFSQGQTTLIVQQLSPVISLFAPGGVYSGSLFEAVGNVTGLAGSGGSSLDGSHLSFTYYSADLQYLTPLSQAPSQAGHYRVVAHFPSTENYASDTALADFTIAPRTLVVSATAASKIYDGTTTAAVTLSDDRVAGDDLSVSYTSAAFATAQVGTGLDVTVEGLTLSGAAAGNYTLASTVVQTTADITPRPLAVSATAASKIYDGTTTAAVTLSDDRVVGDDVTVSYTSAEFATAQVGTGLDVTVNGLTLSGAAAGNYTLASTVVQTTADIAPRTLVVSASAASKIYDGTTTAAVTLSDDRVAGDDLTVSYTSADFAMAQVGTGRDVTVNGLTLSGTAAGNYTLASTVVQTTADIAPRTLMVSATAASKIYNGTTTAAVTLSDDRVTGDDLTVSYNSADFAMAQVGTGRDVTVNGLTLSGAVAGNYTLASTVVQTTADITPRPLAVSATAASKIYDGTTAAAVTLSDDRVAGDDLTVSYTSAAFATAQVGTGRDVTVEGLTLSGAAAGNYTLASTVVQTTADITPGPLAVSATAASKIYDGTTAAAVTLSDDRVAGDDVTVSYTSAEFATAQVGTGLDVTVNGLTLSGAAAGNYTLASTVVQTTADIAPRPLAVSATAASRIYNGTTAAAVTLSDDRVTGDDLTVSYTSAAFATAQVGTGRDVTVNGLTLSGAAAGNYTLASTSVTTTADILPAADVEVISAVTDGGTLLTITYRVLHADSPSFVMGVYTSELPSFEGGGWLGSIAISEAADRTVGWHEKTVAIGIANDAIPLPGAGAAEGDSDDFLLVVADPTDANLEGDGVTDESNVAAITGVYHASSGPVMVQGSTAADTVVMDGPSHLVFNGTAFTYPALDVTGWRIRTHGGDDLVNLAAAVSPAMILGGAGDDTLIGGVAGDALSGGLGNDVVLGGAGNDVLKGNEGRDLLAGGTGVDSLLGDAGEDLLIPGTMIWFDEGNQTIDPQAIQAIMAEWVRADFGVTDRINHLRTGQGINGAVVLDGSTILSDGVDADWLQGGDDLDWFWLFDNDQIADLGDGELENLN